MGIVPGCSRPFWRRQADQDSYHILSEKLNDPRWCSPRIDIQPEPMSRFYDPYDLDCGPLPPDDPAANEFMQCANGFSGSTLWHKLGQSFSVENPHWLESFGLSADGTSADPEGPRIEHLTLGEALELSYIHSREYQTAIEELYLSALDLTFDRFQFAVRYLGLGGREPSVDLSHESIPHADDSLSLNQRFGISQLLPSGGQWIVEIANNTLWLFSGGNQSNSASVLSYSMVQPLLLGAGRKVVLASLTQSERNVLYATRDLARFRQEFFVNTVAGNPAGGYLGLLQQRQSVINQLGNLQRLQERLEQQRAITSRVRGEVNLAELPAGVQIPATFDQLSFSKRLNQEKGVLKWLGEMSPEQEQQLAGLSADPAWRNIVTQLASQLRAETSTSTLSVLQLQSQLASSQGTLRIAERRYQDLLDQFKVHLGLPPDLPVSIDESLLGQFTLIDNRLNDLEQRVRGFVRIWANLNERQPDPAQMRKVADGLEQLIGDVRMNGLPLLDADFERVKEILPQRLTRLDTEEQREKVQTDIARDRRLYDGLKDDLREVETRLNSVRGNIGKIDTTKPQPAGGEGSAGVRELGDLRERILKITQSLQVIQIGLRTELISLEPFEMTMEETLALGLENRVDLMNSLARVTDARRKVEVAANRLEAMLDVVVEGDIRTPNGNHPLEFRGDQSSFRAGLRFTAPLDQVAERNAYRAAQIDYQRARRSYMAFEDRVKSEIRFSHRQLSVLKQNFETARQAVRISALEYDSAVEQAAAPLQQGGQSAINLLRALDNVLSAQNGLIQTWVQYEQNRLNIHRDMGMMDIDADGVWNDRFYRQHTGTSEGQNAVPPPPLGQSAASQFGNKYRMAGAGNPGRSPWRDSRQVTGPSGSSRFHDIPGVENIRGIGESGVVEAAAESSGVEDPQDAGSAGRRRVVSVSDPLDEFLFLGYPELP